MISCQDIAKTIVYLSDKSGDPISNLKLQKLLYYTQGWHLAIFGQAVFAEDIQAWIHGPAVPEVYRAFKDYGSSPIPPCESAPDIDIATGEHIRNVLSAYNHLSAWQLEQLTHSEEPWIVARGGIPDDQSSDAVITHESMRSFFLKKLKENESQEDR
jgi:uncharacterized phage-associated protein